MKISKLLFISLVGLILNSLASLCLADMNTHEIHDCRKTTYFCGPSVKVDGNKFTLDRSLIAKLSKKPTLENLGSNVLEIIYFVALGDREAMGLALEYMTMVNPNSVQIDNPYEIRTLARVLTRNDVFWDVLSKKKYSTRKKVIQYLDINKTDYTLGYDYEEFKAEALQNGATKNH